MRPARGRTARASNFARFAAAARPAPAALSAPASVPRAEPGESTIPGPSAPRDRTPLSALNDTGAGR
eukprot:3520196-Alexandrium_andersonii.AAC.1